MHSLLGHPFIAYVLVLSAALMALTAALLRILPQGGRHRPWLAALPLVVPVISYLVNFVIAGKTCGVDGGYVGVLAGLPSYHVFCRLNAAAISWLGPVSLVWLAAATAWVGIRWYRARRLLRLLPEAGEGRETVELILDELCVREGSTAPPVKVVDFSQPLLLVSGFFGHTTVVISTGALRILEEDELRAALAHELAHARHSGRPLSWLLVLCRSLTLFSPASLWSYATFRKEEEKVCDAEAASRTGLGAELASAIVKFIRCGSGAVGRREALRVQRLLSPPGMPDGGLVSSPYAMYVLMTLLLFGLVFIC